MTTWLKSSASSLRGRASARAAEASGTSHGPRRRAQVVELAVLLALLELDVVLLEPVERQLRVVVDVDLHGVLAELLADRANFLR